MGTTEPEIDERRGSLVLLGGPPGSGKSTVAGLLASGATGPAVHVHTDSFYVWIRSGFVPPVPAGGAAAERGRGRGDGGGRLRVRERGL